MMTNNKACILFAISLVACIPLSIHAQESSLASFEKFYFTIAMVNNRHIIAAVELAPDQQRKLKDLQNEIRNEMGKLNLRLNLYGNKPTSKDVISVEEFLKNNEPKLNEIVLSHQLKRFEQIFNQSKVRSDLLTCGMLKKETLEALGVKNISRKTIKKIGNETKEDILKLSEEFDRKMEQLLMERDRKIKSLVNEEARLNFDKHFGKPFVRFLEEYIISKQWIADQKSRELLEKLKANKLPYRLDASPQELEKRKKDR